MSLSIVHHVDPSALPFFPPYTMCTHLLIFIVLSIINSFLSNSLLILVSHTGRQLAGSQFN